MSNSESKKIRLGICMAGAVSAGAYTAGVIDYLIETLERWQIKKDNIRKKMTANQELSAEEKLVPLHDVVIEVLSGASAGGMTAAVLAYSFNDGTHITKRSNELIADNYNRPNDNDAPTKLYNSWINMVDDEKGTTFSKLMDANDVVFFNDMPSLLNSKPIDQIAAKAVPQSIDFSSPPSYISKHLSIVLSVTNLEGVPIDIRFSNIDVKDPTRNVVWMHSGYLHYQFNEHEYLLDFPPEVLNNDNKDHLAAAAKATGAFPFGLANRRMYVNEKLFNEFKRRMILNNKMNVNIELEKDGNYIFTAVDGGAINNEPVGTTVKILESKKRIHHKEDQNYVILIDPFPTVTNASQDYKYSQPENYTLTGQALKLLGAFRHQSAFKQEDLLNGLEMEENKFLIYPVKRKYYYLACGEIGGFSGFLKKSFRQHDYQLGRKNCQAFLRYYFGEDADKVQTITNTRFTPEQLDKWSYNVNYGQPEKPEKFKFPLIPDMLMLNVKAYDKPEEIKNPEYDGLTTAEMNQITDSIDKRISKIVDTSYPTLVDKGRSFKKFIGFIMRLAGGWIKRQMKNAASKNVNDYLYKVFLPQTIKQDELVTKFADIIEKKGKSYQKIKGVWIEIATKGQKIKTITSDGIETEAIADIGDYIVTNDTRAKEKYVVNPDVFNSRYVHSHDNYYFPKGKVYAVQLTADNIINYKLTGLGKLVTDPEAETFLEAPWKESQRVKLNDYLACFPSKNEVYRIATAEFHETYKEEKAL